MSSISRKFLLIYPRFAMDLTATKMPTSIDPQESPIMRPEKKSLTSLVGEYERNFQKSTLSKLQQEAL